MQVLLRLLSRYKGGTLQDIKREYMEIVDGWEIESEVMSNRIRLRRYLKEFFFNQRRINEAARAATEN